MDTLRQGGSALDDRLSRFLKFEAWTVLLLSRIDGDRKHPCFRRREFFLVLFALRIHLKDGDLLSTSWRKIWNRLTGFMFMIFKLFWNFRFNLCLQVSGFSLIILRWLCSVNLDLYKVLVKELARTLDIQCSSNPEVQAAGMVINTMGWVDGAGYEVYNLHLANFIEMVI